MALPDFINHDRVRELGPGLYTAIPSSDRTAPYDRKVTLYDAVVGRSMYHRIFWGTSPQSYSRFARTALASAAEGHYAEVGCGSLLFTASMYAEYAARHQPSLLLVDRSLQMLRRGLKRLESENARATQDIVMLHADGASLPVDAGSLSTILSLNLLHVPCNRPAIIAEWARALARGTGRLFVSALVRSGRWSDRWLTALYHAGELGPALTLDELRDVIAGEWAVIESATLEGNMCFLVARHAG